MVPSKKVSSKVSSNKSESGSQTDVPIFLKKTYHMIDTCEPEVAGWSEDGETFVVKNTDVFEKKIIPQFFKHSKFSSFVRQLNFYGFRKIKYSDTIKIDRKLEAETANFWRFRHENFQRGKPELLIEIKRSNSVSATETKEVEKPEEVGSLKSQVSVLKKRIETMSKDMDSLSSLVQKMALSKSSNEESMEEQSATKRKKVRTESGVSVVQMEEVKSSMDIVQDPFLLPSGSRSPLPLKQRQESQTTSISDDDFVEELFTAFGNDDLGLSLDENMDLATLEVASSQAAVEEDNAPDAKLMKKLSDAMKSLPREMQELLVDRLVAAISSTDTMSNLLARPAHAIDTDNKQTPQQGPIPPQAALKLPPGAQELALPLATATLGALLSQYAHDIQQKGVGPPKSLPIIPAHA